MSAAIVADAALFEGSPTVGQFAWVLIALGLLAGAMVLAWRAFGSRRPRLRRAGRWLAMIGLLIDLALVCYRNLLWHWNCPIDANFDSVLLFVVMLGGVLGYVISMKLVRGTGSAGGDGSRSAVDLVLLPPMIVMQALATVIFFGGFRQAAYFKQAWVPVHMATLLIATLLMAAAAVGGVMYLLLDRGLRGTRPDGVLGGLPSLERLDGLMQQAVLWGFVLLTLSVVTGALVLAQASVGLAGSARWFHLYPGIAGWLFYLAVLGVRFVPRFRGRWLAWMCLIGLALLLTAYVLVYWQRAPM